MFYRLRILIIILVCGFYLIACSTIQQQNNIDGSSETVNDNYVYDDFTITQQQKVFDELWETVNDNYVYEDFNGIDWEEVKATYQKQIDAGLSTNKFYESMSEMVALLGDDHSRFLSPAATKELDQLNRGSLNYVGIGLFFHPLPRKGYAVTLFPFPDGPAQKAGIAAHDRLLEVEGIPFCCDEHGLARKDLVLGPEGTSVTLTVQTPGEEPRQLTIIRSAVQADFQVVSHRLDGNIGYLLVPTFLASDVAEKTVDAWSQLTAMGSLDGLILDLRTCEGGVERELIDILKLFVTGNQGTFINRVGNRPLIFRGIDIASSQEIPMVVLVGEITESFGEVMAGVLQESGRAILVGSRTAGNIEAIHLYGFSDGSSVWIAQEIFLPPSGTNWEHVGILPDVEIDLEWDDFATESEDLVLNYALELLIRE